MEEIRRTKIKEAMKETLNVYEKLDLNMTEIEIVSRSQNVAAKVTIAKKQLETEAEERLEEQQTPMKIKIIKRKLNGKYDFKWLYAGKFAEGISEEASTKEGKLSPTTKSIKGSFYERSLDNAYEISVDESNLVSGDTKAAEAIKAWFSKVQEKNGGLG